MKHSVAPQLRKAISSAFFCAVCKVMGIRIALRFGRNTSLLIARAKANLLRGGKNPDESWVSSTRPPPCLDFPVSSSSNDGEYHRCLSSGIRVFSSFGLRPKGWSACVLHAQLVQGFSWGSDVGYARVFCKGGKVLYVFLRLLGLGFGVVPELCTSCRSP